MKYRVSKEDFLKNKLVNLGWHPCVIKVWDETGRAGAQAKNPGSQLTKVEFKILAGPDKDSTLYTQFSELLLHS
jgi:hypothetical protein